MRLRWILSLTVLLASFGTAVAQETATVLRHVTVVDVAHGTLLPDRAVEIRGDRIAAVTAASGYTPPEGARVLDLPGRYLVPGFVEMHAHVLAHPWDAEGNLKPRYDREATLAMLRLMLAHGITTVRDPGSETETAVTLRKMLAEGKVTGPSLLTAGRILNSSDFDPEPFAVVKDEAAIRNEIRWQAAAGVDFIKVYSSMPPELVRVAVEEAHAHGLRVIGHLQRTTWTQAAELGIDAITHGASWSQEYLSETDRKGYEQTVFGRVYWLRHLDLKSPAVTAMAEALVRHQVTIDPTLIAMHTKFWGNDPRYTRHPQMGLVPEGVRRGWPKGSFTASWTDDQYRQAQAQWPKMQGLTKLLLDRGVLLTVGTDKPTPWIIPGVSFHEEMQLLADAGIPAKDVLRMATINGARALGKEKSIGAVEAGMRADLVVLRADPLVDIKNTREIETVIQGGKIYEPAKLLATTSAVSR
ncbi:MAG TPA: amidohydrolase family protein [Thermoanaerobaculia bacterium]|jgi:imidazolonepropionase-like amidohydrolase|nr:amidohydrolase family protein [Thermoanaerobaculia bacterium]